LIAYVVVLGYIARSGMNDPEPPLSPMAELDVPKAHGSR
jgi:hypothetical protein